MAAVNFKANEDLNSIYRMKIVDKVFAEASVENGSFDTPAKDREDNLKIVFTSLHGTSITMVPEVLKKAGYKQCSYC